jgi:hypothetical protein
VPMENTRARNLPGTIERLYTRLAHDQYEVTFVMAASFLAQKLSSRPRMLGWYWLPCVAEKARSLFL